jgi:hypothetical protein
MTGEERRIARTADEVRASIAGIGEAPVEAAECFDCFDGNNRSAAEDLRV